MAVSSRQVAERLAHVRDRIGAAGGSTDQICIIAVTKGFDPETVIAAVDAGLVDIGENYAGELTEKHVAVSERGRHCRWHFLGHVQRNKVRSIAPFVHMWQAVDRLAAGEEIARRSPGANVLVQVNVSGEPAKNGCSFDDAPSLVEQLSAAGVKVCGLMAVGPTGSPEGARSGFRRLSALADRLSLKERSMGMSDDLEVAVQEGTTMVRLGRALFGERPLPDRLRR